MMAAVLPPAQFRNSLFERITLDIISKFNSVIACPAEQSRHLPNLIVTQFAEISVDLLVSNEDSCLAPDGVGLVRRTAELRLTQFDTREPALAEAFRERGSCSIRDVYCFQ